MNKYEKVTFITDLIKNVQDNILKNVDKMPEDWNGAEFRMYISDKFKEIVFKENAKLKRNYNNDVLINNL
ncbi:MAG: hypothetical protein WC332_02325 [Clostridia bacterium]